MLGYSTILPLLLGLSVCRSLPANPAGLGAKRLDFSSRGLTEVADDFSRYPELEEIDYSNNDITGVGMNAFSSNTKLRLINFSGNRQLNFPDEGPFLVTRATFLNLSHCNIEYVPGNAFDEMPYLEVLDISRNPIVFEESVAFEVMMNPPKKIILSEIPAAALRYVCHRIDTTIVILDEHKEVTCKEVRKLYAVDKMKPGKKENLTKEGDDYDVDMNMIEDGLMKEDTHMEVMMSDQPEDGSGDGVIQGNNAEIPDGDGSEADDKAVLGAPEHEEENEDKIAGEDVAKTDEDVAKTDEEVAKTNEDVAKTDEDLAKTGEDAPKSEEAVDAPEEAKANAKDTIAQLSEEETKLNEEESVIDSVVSHKIEPKIAETVVQESSAPKIVVEPDSIVPKNPEAEKPGAPMGRRIVPNKISNEAETMQVPKAAGASPNADIVVDAPKVSEDTEAKPSSSSAVILFIILGVVTVGSALVGYRYWKDRKSDRYDAVNGGIQENPELGRELKEIKSEKTEGRTAESSPLMQRIGDVEFKEVSEPLQKPPRTKSSIEAEATDAKATEVKATEGESGEVVAVTVNRTPAKDMIGDSKNELPHIDDEKATSGSRQNVDE